MASGGDIRGRSATQQEIDDGQIDYYDIMVIGKAGMGKTTTADKLLVANPHCHNYQGAQHSEPEVNRGCLSVEDLSIWFLSNAPDELERVKTRLKNIVFFRSLDNPHDEINCFHSEDQSNSRMTPDLELISNESTKIRVLDVPGFFGEGDAGTALTNSIEVANRAAQIALRRMQNILRLQSDMKLKFRRILYFLPVRGALRRADAYLEMELSTLAKYFGKAIFDNMVVITTIPPEAYDDGNKVVFSEKAITATKKCFNAALAHILPDEKISPQPSFLFISMADTCETILANVKSAHVACDYVTLQFNTQRCARCYCKIKILESQRVSVCIDESNGDTISYDESTCHPLFIPKYTDIIQFFGGIVRVISGKTLFKDYLDEVCVECNKKRGTHGCTRVKTRYELKGNYLMVDHTSNTSEPIMYEKHKEPLPNEPSSAVQIKQCEQQPVEAENPEENADEQQQQLEVRDMKSGIPMAVDSLTLSEAMKLAIVSFVEHNRREVDHTSQIINPIPDEEAAEGGDAEEAIANVSVAYEHRQRERQPAEAENANENADEKLQQVRDVKSGIPMAVDFLTEAMKLANVSFVEHNRREVDHTSQVVNPVPDEEAAEGGDAGEGTSNVSVAYENRQRERQPAEAESAKENADKKLQQVRDVKSGIPMAVDFLTEAMKLANVSFVEHNRREVDHTSQVVNPVPDEEAAEGGDAGEGTSNVSVAYENRQRERQPAEAENAKENADEQLQQVRDVKSGIPMAVDFLTEAMRLANVSFVEHNVLECDYSGIEYTNKKHNFSLQIPEGAIPKGEKIRFEIAIAMHGPFILPKNTRLVSPILWLCPFEENIKMFSKPFRVVIPHILHKITEEKAKKYQLGFAKANHRKISYNNAGNAEYNFQPLTPLECNAVFSSTNELGFGTVTMSHFCYLCITAKNTSELKSDISYCLTRAERPATARRHEVCFCVSYYLGTCIEVGYTLIILCTYQSIFFMWCMYM